MASAQVKRLDRKMVERAIEIASKLGLEYDIVLKADRLDVVYYLYKDNLGEYTELCRRLANAKMSIREKAFVDEPMKSPVNRHIGEVSISIPLLKEKV